MKYRLALLAAVLLLPPGVSLAQIEPPSERRPWFCFLPRWLQTRDMRSTCSEWGRLHRPLARADQDEAREDGPPVDGELLQNDQLGDEPAKVVFVEHAGATHEVLQGQTAFSTGASGHLRVLRDGRYNYTPPVQGLVPSDGIVEVFRYRIRDTDGDISSAEFRINILDNDLFPDAVGDSASATEGVAAPVQGNVLSNDSPGDTPAKVSAAEEIVPNGSPIALAISQSRSTASNGSITLERDGRFRYVAPPAGSVPVAGINEKIRYTIQDDDGDEDSAELTISVSDSGGVPAPDPCAIDPYSRACLAQGTLIRRDEFRVPHVLADSIPAAYFGFGYAQAEDRLQAILIRIILARGELTTNPLTTTLFPSGSAAGATALELDKNAFRFSFDDGGVTEADLNADVLGAIKGYVAGVNAYIADHPGSTGTTGIASISVNDVIAAARAAIIGLVPGSPGSSQGPGGGAASNAWALGPSRSATGHAMLMGDPHLDWEPLPGMVPFYEGQISVRDPASPGALLFNFYGVATPGAGLMSIGFNQHLGWTLTGNSPDISDVFLFEVDPADSEALLYDNNGDGVVDSNKMNCRTFTDGQTICRSDDFGPVIARTTSLGNAPIPDGRPIARVFRSSIFLSNPFPNQFYDMAGATNLVDFKTALDINAIPLLNVIYGDRSGNILYRWMARLPNTASGLNFPIPANSAAAVWSNQVPGSFQSVSALPNLENPADGYLQNANDHPKYTTLGQPPAAGVSFIEHDRLRLRSQLSLELIRSRERFTLEELFEAKHNLKSMLAERLRGELVDAARTTAPGLPPADQAVLNQAADVLAIWDGTTGRESRGGVLFELWWEGVRGINVFDADESNPAIWREVWDPANPIGTPRGLANPGAAATELLQAAKNLNSTFPTRGGMNVKWGDVHRLKTPAALNLPMNGGPASLGSFRVANFVSASPTQLKLVGGDGWVFAVEFDPLRPRAFALLGFGQSASAPASYRNTSPPPSYLSQAEMTQMFIEGRPRPVYFTEADIQANKEESYSPGP